MKTVYMIPDQYSSYHANDVHSLIQVLMRGGWKRDGQLSLVKDGINLRFESYGQRQLRNGDLTNWFAKTFQSLEHNGSLSTKVSDLVGKSVEHLEPLARALNDAQGEGPGGEIE